MPLVPELKWVVRLQWIEKGRDERRWSPLLNQACLFVLGSGLSFSSGIHLVSLNSPLKMFFYDLMELIISPTCLITQHVVCASVTDHNVLWQLADVCCLHWTMRSLEAGAVLSSSLPPSSPKPSSRLTTLLLPVPPSTTIASSIIAVCFFHHLWAEDSQVSPAQALW